MSLPPWEVYNATTNLDIKSIDFLRILITPLSNLQNIASILLIISLVMIILGIVEVKRSRNLYAENTNPRSYASIS